MLEKENEKLLEFTEKSKNETDDGSDGDDGGFGAIVQELTKKAIENECLEPY